MWIYKCLQTFFLLGLVPTICLAQDELDFKPRTDFNDGLGIMSPDTSFLVNFRFRMQNRIGVYTKAVDDFTVDEVEARVRRLRLRMDGFLVDPKFSYYIQLSFSRGDQDWDNSGVPNVVRDAALFYFISPQTYLCFGQTKLPGNRQRVISSGMQQFAERSIVNATFNIDRDFGIRLYHEQPIWNMVVRKHLSLSTGDGRNALNSDNGLAYTSRLEWLPLGLFTNDGDYFEGDLMREKKPKIALGTTISYNEKAVRTGGQIGTFLNDATDIRTFIADGVFKYKGFSVYGEYFLRNATKFLVTNQDGEADFIYSGTGVMVQTSYLFKKNIEIAGRFAQIKPVDEVRTFSDGDSEIALGITKYLNRHRTKVQLNIFHQNNHYNLNIRDDRWGIMFQIEVGI